MHQARHQTRRERQDRRGLRWTTQHRRARTQRPRLQCLGSQAPLRSPLASHRRHQWRHQTHFRRTTRRNHKRNRHAARSIAQKSGHTNGSNAMETHNSLNHAAGTLNELCNTALFNAPAGECPAGHEKASLRNSAPCTENPRVPSKRKRLYLYLTDNIIG